VGQDGQDGREGQDRRERQEGIMRELICVVAIVSFSCVGRAEAQAPGVGSIAFANSGAAAAQQDFLTGLAQLHNFEYGPAAELFKKAQQTDPGFAMAYWGEAMTYNHPVWMEQNISAARTALKRLGPDAGARLVKAKTAREKDYLRAVETLYGDGDKYARDFAYADAMAELHRTYPDDVDATAFSALSLLGTTHEGRDFSVYMRAAALLEPLFPTQPSHPGIAHYLIHSYDDPTHAPLGLRAARAYSKIAPSAGHAQHMCSHIFVAMGMWDDMVSANESAMRVVNEARAKRGQEPAACGHYPSWLEYGYLQQGRFPEAKQLVADCYAAAKRAVEAQQHASKGTVDPDASAIGSFAAMRTRYLLDTEEWTGDVAGWVVPAGLRPRPEVAFQFTAGYLAIKTGRKADAAAALARLKKARTALDGEFADAPPNSGEAMSMRGWANVLDRQLSALVQWADGATAQAIAQLKEAAAIEDKLPYEFGPPFIDKPSYELLGEALLAANQRDEARAAFQKALTRTPGRVTSVRGLKAAGSKS
jgi:tetratricopeptide (TPR) repeat protein